MIYTRYIPSRRGTSVLSLVAEQMMSNTVVAMRDVV